MQLPGLRSNCTFRDVLEDKPSSKRLIVEVANRAPLGLRSVSMTQHVAATSPEVTIREPRRSRPSLPGKDGWTPAYDDHTPDAVAWRAAYALEESKRAHDEIGTLRTSMDSLNKTMTKVDTGIRSFLRWVLGIATVIVTTALLGGLAIAWRWVSTLHH